MATDEAAAMATAERGRRLLDAIGDIPGLRVGHWTHAEAATGCTVVLTPPDGAAAAVAVRGGAPGTRETDLLSAANTVERVNAVLLTGGSAFGLAAATGVVRFLEEHGAGFETRAGRVPRPSNRRTGSSRTSTCTRSGVTPS
jgi:L-aminopeptidase/D-esterase-like protein